MDIAAEIKKALKEVLDVNPNLCITAEVVSVEDQTCTVKLLSELIISDVRLNATITDDLDTLIIKPKIGSDVVVMSQTGDLKGLIVIKIDSVEKIFYKKGDFQFEIDGTTGKVTLKNATANLGALMNNLIDAIIGIQINNSDSTTGVINPALVAPLTDIKTKFNSLLNIV
jgi:hypothetical protein